MKWIFRTLVGAVVAGVGWKLGADAYEALKKQVHKYYEEKETKKGEDNHDEEEGAAATQTHTIEVSEEKPPKMEYFA